MSAGVLTYRPPVPARPLRHAAVAFRCEVTAYDLSGSREVILAYYRAASPRLAARWMRAEAQRLARLLAPEPNTPHLESVLLVAAGPDCPRPDDDLLAWASSDERYEHALRVLASGHTYLLNVTDYDARYSVRTYALPTRSRPLQSPAPAGCSPYAPAGAGRHRKPRRWRFGR
ncbi:hypothetical protein [Streptomyces sp. FIT100]|uniref:hypothetical protein n=1 Tax=Streptomyces sp. FIT100 TaxID=2837956 RepID=UPI0021CA12F3|nr:hypothetical protein [Streptomyces sp. FIT100]UUN29415.1 hypothetical protein KK483_25835 [Streptomyces sp. FIT100]